MKPQRCSLVFFRRFVVLVHLGVDLDGGLDEEVDDVLLLGQHGPVHPIDLPLSVSLNPAQNENGFH